jgi:putative nucleotidyltransferase-like protein
LKGAALAPILYGDIGLRPFTDLDVLIQPKDLECATDYLFRLGYESQVVRNATFQAQFNFEQHFQRLGQSSSFVDLHWHLVSSVYHRERIELAWFWDRTCKQTIGGVQTLVLNPNAMFMHLCMHLVFHHASRILLRTYDLALWILRYGTSADWDEIVSAAIAFHLAAAIRSACAAAYHDWGIGLPAEIADRLKTLRVSAAERAVFRVVSNPDQRLIPLVNLAFQPGIGSKLSYVKAMLFPSEAFLRTTMPASAQGPWFIMVLRRILRTPRRWLRAARQILHRG